MILFLSVPVVILSFLRPCSCSYQFQSCVRPFHCATHSYVVQIAITILSIRAFIISLPWYSLSLILNHSYIAHVAITIFFIYLFYDPLTLIFTVPNLIISADHMTCTSFYLFHSRQCCVPNPNLYYRLVTNLQTSHNTLSGLASSAPQLLLWRYTSRSRWNYLQMTPSSG